MGRELVGRPLNRSIHNKDANMEANMRMLERRVADLERLLSKYTEQDIVGIDPRQNNIRQRLRVLAINGPSEGEETATPDCPLGSLVNGKITPGYVIGGGKNILVEPPKIKPAANKKVWLKITWTIDLIDEVPQAGGTMGSITVRSGNTVPTDDVPSATDTSGTCYYALGGWDSDTQWVGNGCGTVVIGFCPFVFRKGRQ